MPTAQQIKAAIDEYAKAYQAIQHFQETSCLIPEGDQKTGCIGEFYVCLYLRHKYPDATLTFGSISEKGWDIIVESSGRPPFKAQVKTVSAYSKSRTISPIHYGWDKLYIIFVDRLFEPRGFWIINSNNIVRGGEKLENKKCRDPNNPSRRGSDGIPFGENRVSELREALPWHVGN